MAESLIYICTQARPTKMRMRTWNNNPRTLRVVQVKQPGQFRSLSVKDKTKSSVYNSLSYCNSFINIFLHLPSRNPWPLISHFLGYVQWSIINLHNITSSELKRRSLHKITVNCKLCIIIVMFIYLFYRIFSGDILVLGCGRWHEPKKKAAHTGIEEGSRRQWKEKSRETLIICVWSH